MAQDRSDKFVWESDDQIEIIELAIDTDSGESADDDAATEAANHPLNAEPFDLGEDDVTGA